VGGPLGSGDLVLRRDVATLDSPRSDSSTGTGSSPSTDADQGGTSGLTRDQLRDLVDAVCDRIEWRVVEELERRGRRHNPGVF
jgi:hypothetical protein